jgi:hypothetical protein
LPTRKPVAEPNEHGELVVRARPDLEFTRHQVALALAVTYGSPRGRVGPTNIPTALHELVRMALMGEDIAAPESTIAAWHDRLAAWEVWPS